MKRLWLVLTAVLVSVLLAGAVGCDRGPGLWSREHRETSVETVELSGQTKLVASVKNGTVRFVGSAGATEMRFDVTKRVRARTAADAREHIDDISVAIDAGAEQVYVEVDHPASGERDYVVDLEIAGPELFEFDINLGNGEVWLSSVEGPSLLNVGNGEIEIADVESESVMADLGNGVVRADLVVLRDGTAVIHVGNGEIDADVSATGAFALDFGVGNGHIRLEIPEETDASVSASVSIGDIDYSGLTFEDLQESKRVLQGVLGQGLGQITLSAGVGGIDLRGR